jgi:chitin disaccharide deacetylase
MADRTYAERLGWKAEDRVVIFHVDDGGMSHSSNMGAIRSLEAGVATSCSLMMPCSWVSEFVHYWKQHPDLDIGLHVTLTSEWAGYRWGPVAGKARVPGLTDPEGCLWPDVPAVVEHATPEEVETEIRAQLDRLLTMGLRPTHLDTHMGTVFGSAEFIQKYLMVGIEKDIPVFLPGGHNQYMIETGAIPPHIPPAMIGMIAESAWDSGSPVLDDAHITGYDWELEEKVDAYIGVLKKMRPGLTQIIVHSTDPSDAFEAITDSGPTRRSDMHCVCDPRLRKCIEDEGIILTTWRELGQRRKAAE